MEITSLIPVGAWLWDKYGKSLTDKTAGVIKGQWDKVRWTNAAEAYRAKIKKLHGTMQIIGMAESVPLDDIFTDAYMLDKPTAFGRFDIERLSADPHEDPSDQRINGLRLVVEKQEIFDPEKRKAQSRDRNLYILGKPGAGKTTFLKYIALQAAQGNIDKIPIFISLKRWADSGLDLMSFVSERFEICDFPEANLFAEELLKSGNALVLFDGLDEVSQQSGLRDKQTLAMHNFVEKYDKAQCLITCRIAASDYCFEPFTYVELADFNESQIHTFVRNWFRKDGEKDEETSARFLAEFHKDDNKGLRDLARTPLLLTLLCIAFDETFTMPTRRVEIYHEALEALLKKWDASRRIKRDEVYRQLSPGHKENMLARIGAETFEKNEYFIPQAELERLIVEYVKNIPPHSTLGASDGEIILKTIEVQHGIFVERARRIYSFSHLTFQEYFAAKYIVDNATKGTLTNLIIDHFKDVRWREVFLLTTSMLSDATQFMMRFRAEIDTLIDDKDERLTALLDWSDKKASFTAMSPWSGRFAYLFLALYHPFQELSFKFDLNLALDSALTFVLANVRRSYYVETLSDALSNAFNAKWSAGLPHDINLHMTRARAFSRNLGLKKLSKELVSFSVPKESASVSEQETFARRFQALMTSHRNIGLDWNLTEAEQERLANFLKATHLLHDCLLVATMPPDEKTTILNTLYLARNAYV